MKIATWTLFALVMAPIAQADEQPLSAGEVRMVVEAKLGSVKTCMSKEAPSGPKGKVVIHYLIMPSGKVDKASVHESTTENAKLDRCIVDVFRDLQFPKPRDNATMEQLYPFQFTAPPPVGDLLPAVVANAVKPHLEQVKACFQPGVTEEKSVHGKVIVHFVVKPTGVVASAKVVKSETGFAAGDTCLIEAIKKWTFPKPTGSGDATIPDYPFIIDLKAGTDVGGKQPEKH
jgi:TonB family protein